MNHELAAELTRRHQVAIERAHASPGRRWLFADDTGLGKTRQALLAAGADHGTPLLVVCPAMARETWRREAAKWTPGASVGVINCGQETKQSKKKQAEWPGILDAQIRVVNPENLVVGRETKHLQRSQAALVLDECHQYVDPGSERSEALTALTAAFPGPVYGLSATPIPNRIMGVWNPVSLLRPGMFGRQPDSGGVPWNFLWRYAEREWNGYGQVWGALRQDHAEELRFRLGHMMSRFTRGEIAHLLPACQVLPLGLGADRSQGQAWREWLDEAVAQHTHAVVAFHRRKSVHDAARRLGGLPGVLVEAITGEQPAGVRDARIQRVAGAPRGVLLTTMHAVKESIDLSWAGRALLAELYWRPATLAQFVGRFGRPGGVGTLLHVLVRAGSVYERMAASVADKLLDTAAVLPEGKAEGQLRGALRPEISIEELARVAGSVCIDNEWADLEGLLEEE